jgi:hypothetical protein
LQEIRAAIAADDAHLATCRGSAQGPYPRGYVPHDHQFPWFAASMVGASGIVQNAALQTAARVNLPELMRQPARVVQSKSVGSERSRQ